MDATQTHNRTRTKTKLDDGKPDYVQLPSEDQVLILQIGDYCHSNDLSDSPSNDLC